MVVASAGTRLGRAAAGPGRGRAAGRGGFGSARSAGTSSLELATKLGEPLGSYCKKEIGLRRIFDVRPSQFTSRLAALS